MSTSGDCIAQKVTCSLFIPKSIDFTTNFRLYGCDNGEGLGERCLSDLHLNNGTNNLENENLSLPNANEY